MATETVRSVAEEFSLVEDELLVAKALINWAGPIPEIDTPRECRAWMLVDAIAADRGIEADKLAATLDEEREAEDRHDGA
jgi:hypothetical protein